VILCSMQTKVDDVANLVARTSRARSLIVAIPDRWKLSSFPMRTSVDPFPKANAYRISDLSGKRNLGLVLARLHGWNKVVFIDDDIILSQTDNLARLAGQLDKCQVAGMLVHNFPDNSVVCHARRAAGLPQDVFVTGAVLGVQCNRLPLSFFPDVYNEDWFFFAKEAAARDLPSVGHASQTEYNPFATPDRARWEEFGDLLAEGLYALFGRQSPGMPFDERLDRATTAYWQSFIEARLKAINIAHRALYRLLDRDPSNGRADSALKSLAAAKDHLKNVIKPDLCVKYLEAWRDDLADWQKFSNGVNKVGNTREAMDFVQLKTWTLAEFGAAVVDSETAAFEFESSVLNSEAVLVRAESSVVNSASAIFSSEAAPTGLASV
jgi:hypothetical protein